LGPEADFHRVVVHDRDGGHLMVQYWGSWRTDMRGANRIGLLHERLRAAIDATPGVRASNVTRQRLAGALVVKTTLLDALVLLARAGVAFGLTYMVVYLIDTLR
jgi:hypothetical protein